MKKTVKIPVRIELQFHKHKRGMELVPKIYSERGNLVQRLPTYIIDGGDTATLAGFFFPVELDINIESLEALAEVYDIAGLGTFLKELKGEKS